MHTLVHGLVCTVTPSVTFPLFAYIADQCISHNEGFTPDFLTMKQGSI